ncbi:hypothetical protein [Streptomyces mayonensis]|uniref:hypothetical protein n=1 Tax=Streptomyces mayonensis TaxID=2750816 RepID=UPI0020A6B19A|nr:hypothetical protein [Streptomyces sp. A108]
MSDGNDARRDARAADDAPEETGTRHGGGPAVPDAPEPGAVVPDAGGAGAGGADTDQQSKHAHTGNGTVNDGPAAQGPTPQGAPEEPGLPATDARRGPDGRGGPAASAGRGGAAGGDARGGGDGRVGGDGRAGAEGSAGVAGPGSPVGPVGPAGPVSPAGPAGANGVGSPGSPVGANDVSGPEGPGRPGSRTVGPGAPTATAPGDLDADELALRRMLRGAVQDVRPSDGTLEHLRRAVPARRARKRQAVVGAAAAALFLGTAVPALVHVSGSPGRDADPSVAGNASQAQGGSSQGKDPAGGQSGVAGSGEKTEGGERTDPTETPGDKESGAARGSAPGEEPSASTAADVPACTAGRLGPAEVASIAEPDSVGVVYGSFRVTNVSSEGCTVTGPGNVVTTSLGTADASRIGTARHAAGDAAAGLPDPSLEAASLTLAPGSAYEVKFAWVPSETCPTPGSGNGGGSGGPSADPSPTGDTTAGGGASTAGGESGPTTQLLTDDGPADGSVSVTYTPAGGSGAATATVPNACTGTVYWTGVLEGTGS